MTDFLTWARHYDYDPATDEARSDYAEYQRMAGITAAIFGTSESTDSGALR